MQVLRKSVHTSHAASPAGLPVARVTVIVPQRRFASASLSSDPSSQILRLSDGRQISYGLFGALDNVKSHLVYHHGMPGSRYDGIELKKAAAKLGIQVIAPDRPGYASSTAIEKRTLRAWAEDTHALTRHLGLKRYYIGGVSGGGPHALACARYLPTEEVQGVAVIAGLAPPWISFRSTIGTIQSIRALVRFFPNTTAKAFDARFGAPHRDFEHPEEAQESVRDFLRKSYFGKNVELVHSDEFARFISKSLAEAFKHDHRGHAGDIGLLLGRWDFDLADIPQPGKVTFYVGTEDTDTPLAMSKAMSNALKGSRLKTYEGKDHWDLLHNHAEDVLGDVMSSWSSDTTAAPLLRPR